MQEIIGLVRPTMGDSGKSCDYSEVNCQPARDHQLRATARLSMDALKAGSSQPREMVSLECQYRARSSLYRSHLLNSTRRRWRV